MNKMNKPPFTDDSAGRERLRDLLGRWQKGVLDERAVHEAAEALSESYPGELPTYPHSDPRSIPIEVLSQLEILNWQLITREDIPALLDFRSRQVGACLQAISWERDHPRSRATITGRSRSKARLKRSVAT